jgi:hypothetical protein
MTLRKSISHPELLVGSNGSIYLSTNGQRINLIQDHGTTMRGHMIAYRYNGKIKQLSVLRLVFEAHIKKAKIQTNDYVETIDGNDYNPDASNLTTGSRYRKPAKKTKVDKNGEAYSTWMGIDEVYC